MCALQLSACLPLVAGKQGQGESDCCKDFFAKMPAALSVVDSDVVSEEISGLIRPHFSLVKTPSTYDKVYKDECMFSFDT